MEGTAHLKNIIYHDPGPYIISSATFPSYFLKDSETVIETQAQLDVQIFIRIANALHISSRYVGEEPTSQVTGIYNQIMAAMLPEAGISCNIIPRKEIDGKPISASTVHMAIKTGDNTRLRSLLPLSTWEWLQTPEAEPVIRRIQNEDNVIHY